MKKVNIDIISGFLGAGKTTVIQKLLNGPYKKDKLVIIENEFGEIGIDGGFLKESGIEIKEMNSGCICCSLVGDFEKSLNEVIEKYAPDRIIIEPSGVGKLSDVKKAVTTVINDSICINVICTIIDVTKFSMYLNNFGEFYKNQIESANSIILSRTDLENVTEEQINNVIEDIKKLNDKAIIISTPIDKLENQTIIAALENAKTNLMDISECEHHHDEECECSHHQEHEHHHHHADEIFTSWGFETATKYSKEQISDILNDLSDSLKYGLVLRAKGIVAGDGGTWIHFDMVPEQIDIRNGSMDYIGRICVIGSKLNEKNLEELFKK